MHVYIGSFRTCAKGGYSTTGIVTKSRKKSARSALHGLAQLRIAQPSVVWNSIP